MLTYVDPSRSSPGGKFSAPEEKTYQQAVAELSLVYKSIFEIFASKNDLEGRILRIAPLAENVMAGHFSKYVADLTRDALLKAFELIDSEYKQTILKSTIEINVFLKKELKDWQDAFNGKIRKDMIMIYFKDTNIMRQEWIR